MGLCTAGKKIRERLKPAQNGVCGVTGLGGAHLPRSPCKRATPLTDWHHLKIDLA